LESNRKYLETRKDIAKQWNRNHFEKIKERVRERARINGKRCSTDKNKKLARNCRTRICSAIKNAKKQNHSVELIGCSFLSLKNWLEYQFDSKMNWDNYGSYWEIDHVIPCNSYDMTIPEEQYECFNWRNLRPLYKIKNRSKNDKILPFEILFQELKVSYYLDKVIDTTLSPFSAH
jgi:hypothetical protein